MKQHIFAITLLAGIAATSHAEIGVLSPAVEDTGTVTYVDSSIGSITIDSTRYEMTGSTIIHYAPGADAIGYKQFKLQKDMNISYKKEKDAAGKDTGKITEIWVLHKQ